MSLTWKSAVKGVAESPDLTQWSRTFMVGSTAGFCSSRNDSTNFRYVMLSTFNTTIHTISVTIKGTSCSVIESHRYIAKLLNSIAFQSSSTILLETVRSKSRRGHCEEGRHVKHNETGLTTDSDGFCLILWISRSLFKSKAITSVVDRTWKTPKSSGRENSNPWPHSAAPRLLVQDF